MIIQKFFTIFFLLRMLAYAGSVLITLNVSFVYGEIKAGECILECTKKGLLPTMYSVIPNASDRTVEWVDWWLERHQEKKKQARSHKIDLLMIGDSITHGWEDSGLSVWNKYYQSRNAFNLGFGADRTEHVLWRLQNGAVENMQPKVVVLMIGTNNTGYRMDPADHTAKGIEAIVKELRQRLPETKILLLAIFPRHLSPYNEMRRRNNMINQQIATLADDKSIYFLNINESFMNEQGELNAEIMPDWLHLNEKGYVIWAQAMEEVLSLLMNQ